MFTGADAQDAHVHKPRIEAEVAQGIVSISPHCTLLSLQPSLQKIQSFYGS